MVEVISQDVNLDDRTEKDEDPGAVNGVYCFSMIAPTIILSILRRQSQHNSKIGYIQLVVI